MQKTIWANRIKRQMRQRMQGLNSQQVASSSYHIEENLVVCIWRDRCDHQNVHWLISYRQAVFSGKKMVEWQRSVNVVNRPTCLVHSLAESVVQDQFLHNLLSCLIWAFPNNDQRLYTLITAHNEGIQSLEASWHLSKECELSHALMFKMG